MKKIIVLYIFLLVQYLSYSQARIYGVVKDQQNNPLPGASVLIKELNKGSVTDKQGKYELTHLPYARLKVQFFYMGYAAQVVEINLEKSDNELNINLTPSPIEAPEVVVTGGYTSAQNENPFKIDLYKINRDNRKNSPNLMGIITQVPGVDMISKGPGVTKPVIRGSSMNDILVMNNGVRFENYQYSDHHPLGIDEYDIENVEIIKGPASLLYGSDAVGGVINFIKEKPAPVGVVQGDVNLRFFSNTLGMSNDIGIKGASQKFFGGVRLGQKSHADFLQGGKSFVPNSRFNELNFHLNTGMTDKSGSYKLYYDYSQQKIGLVEDEAVNEIQVRGRKNEIYFQQFDHHLISSQNKLYFGKSKLELNAGLQSTELIHFGEENVYEIQMRLNTLTYEGRYFIPVNDKSEYIVGFQGMHQQNKNLNDRETILLPDATTNNHSCFGIMQYRLMKRMIFQAGIRYDVKSIKSSFVGIPGDTLTYREALNKTFDNLSGSAGISANLTDNFLLRANVGSAYRTPNLAELTSKGLHELRFEIGDKNLQPENAFEGDLNFQYHSTYINFDLAGFYNHILNYIFITPTGDTTIDGMNIYRYKQENAVIYGGEYGLHYHPEFVEWLHIRSDFSWVVGKQKNGNYLPFIPAHQIRLEISIDRENILFFRKMSVNLSSLFAFSQNRVAPDEDPTAAYSLFDVSIQGELRVKQQHFLMNISVTNLFDRKYISHLSTLKEAGFFDPGRNISLALKIPINY